MKQVLTEWQTHRLEQIKTPSFRCYGDKALVAMGLAKEVVSSDLWGNSCIKVVAT